MLFSILPVAIFGLLAIRNSHDSLQGELGESSLEYARLSLSQITDHLTFQFHELNYWAQLGFLQKLYKKTAESRTFRMVAFLASHPQYHSIVWVDDQSRVVAAAGAAPEPGSDMSSYPGIQKALGGQQSIQDVSFDRLAGSYAMRLSVPIHFEEDPSKTIGALSVALKWDTINRMIAKLKVKGENQSTSDHIMLTNSEGLAISCVDPKEMFTANLVDLGMESARRARQGEEGYLFETTEHGWPGFCAYTYMQGTSDVSDLGWLLVFLQDPERIHAPTTALMSKMFAMLVTVLVFLLGFSFFLAERVGHPIHNLSVAAGDIGKGYLSRRVPVHSKDEIGMLSCAFNAMAENLQNARAVLEDSQRGLALAQEVAQIGSWDWRIRDGTLTWSDTTCRQLGLEPGQIEPSYEAFESFIHPDDRAGVNRAVQATLEEDKPYAVEARMVREDGTEWTMFTRGSVYRNSEGTPVRFVGIQQDITERIRREEVIADQQLKMITAARLSSLGMMAGGVAHEINNPLTTISVATDHLRSFLENGNPDRDAMAGITATIHRNVDRIERIVRGLLSMSRMPKDDDLDTVCLKTFLGDVIEMSRARFAHGGIELVVSDIPPTLDLECQSTPLSQVLVNLLNNARDAVDDLPEKWVRVEVSEEGDAVEIAVTDSGNGLPAEVLDKIFEPFFTAKSMCNGTGLGLSISRSIVNSHHGELLVDRDCVNTRFVVRLPKRQPARQANGAVDGRE
jgi:PAS domain S-box-containing protein